MTHEHVMSDSYCTIDSGNKHCMDMESMKKSFFNQKLCNFLYFGTCEVFPESSQTPDSFVLMCFSLGKL
jgi:hypothetical protein